MTIVAIAADGLADMASMTSKLPGVTLLTDPELEASAAWGLHVKGAQNPSPATFLIGANGVVRWRKLADDNGDWPKYSDLAAAL